MHPFYEAYSDIDSDYVHYNEATFLFVTFLRILMSAPDTSAITHQPLITSRGERSNDVIKANG